MPVAKKISGVVITYNEEQNIERCLKSMATVVDELLVIDSHSTDDTATIAIKCGARVIKNDFEGHIQQKNFAKLQAKNDWVLSLDADESLSPALLKSIETCSFNKDAYRLDRLTNYCGKWIKHCGWYPDRKVRLFQKNVGDWGGKNPHDKYVLPEGATVGHLTGDLLHYTFYTVEEHKAQIHRFSSIAAKAYYEQGIKSNTVKSLAASVFKFIRNYIFKLGFLDGMVGFHICRLSAWATYLKYNKLVKIQKGKNV